MGHADSLPSSEKADSKLHSGSQQKISKSSGLGILWWRCITEKKHPKTVAERLLSCMDSFKFCHAAEFILWLPLGWGSHPGKVQLSAPVPAAKIQVWRRGERFFADSDCSQELKSHSPWAFWALLWEDSASLAHSFNNSPSFSLSSHRCVTAPSAREVIISGSSCWPPGHFQLYNTPARHFQSLAS